MKNKRVIIIIIILMVIMLLATNFYVGYRIIRHERSQSSRIEELENQNYSLNEFSQSLSNELETQKQQVLLLQQDIDYLLNEIQSLKNNKETIDYSEEAYNYLAIGNSITKHRICYYWWDEIGMAASSMDKDYVHLVESWLRDSNESVFVYAINYTDWETQSFDRAETYYEIDPYLSPLLDLVTIQLSECVSDTDTFKEDYLDLIKYIKEKAPNAQIVMIDDFWDIDVKNNILREVSEETGVLLVDLTEIKNNEDYYCGMNTLVYDSDGNEHAVLHEGVATHPGDKGMKFYADEIVKLLKNNK